jgi:hypothetical protein
MYLNGRGLDKNEHEAASWFQKAADQGLAESQYNLGRLYHRGAGVEKDDRLAIAHGAVTHELNARQRTAVAKKRNFSAVWRVELFTVHVDSE